MDSVYKIFYAHRENEQSKLIDLEYNSVSEILANIDDVIFRCMNELNKSRAESAKLTIPTDLHYTTALYPVDKKNPIASSINSLLFDLDSIDTTRIDEYIDSFSALTGLPKNNLGIISSGGGLHFWLELQTPIRATDQNFYVKYKNLCTQLDKGLGAFDLLYTHRTNDGKKKITNFDAHVFDKNKTLRLPGTINTKYDPPRECRIIQYAHTVIDFDSFCDRVSENVAKIFNEKGIISYQDGSVDGFAVTQGCKFLQYYTAHQDEQNFENWHALGLIYLNLYEDQEQGIDAFYEASKNYPGFDEHVFLNKCNSIIASGHKSYGCEKISGMWSGCSTCPHFGKVRSPLYIQGENFVASERDGFWVNRGTIDKPKMYPDYDGLYKKFKNTHKFVINKQDSMYGVWNTETGLWEFDFNKSMHSIKSLLASFCMEHLRIPPKGEIQTEKQKFVDHVLDIPPVISYKEIEEIKRTPYVLSFKNGVFNIKSGECLGTCEHNYMDYKLPYDFDKDAEIPFLWEKVVDQWFNGNQELIDQLGYTFAHVLGDIEYRFHVFHYWYGTGRNGKSLASEVLKRLVGSRYSTVDTKYFTEHRELRGLEGSFVNVHNEFDPAELSKACLEKLKDFCSGNEFEHSEKFENKRRSRMVSKFIFISNDPFNGRTSDSRALNSRLRVLPFIKELEPHEIDTQLIDKITTPESLTGIFKWVKGYMDKLDKMTTFPNTEISKKYIEVFQRDTDLITMFLESEYFVLPDNEGESNKIKIKRPILYKIFKLWCKDQGVNFPKDIGKITFFAKFEKSLLKKLREIRNNFKIYKSNGEVFYKGITFDLERFIVCEGIPERHLDDCDISLMERRAHKECFNEGEQDYSIVKDQDSEQGGLSTF